MANKMGGLKNIRPFFVFSGPTILTHAADASHFFLAVRGNGQDNFYLVPAIVAALCLALRSSACRNIGL